MSEARAMSVLARALDVPPERRDAFVREASAGDEAVCRRVFELLQADARAHALLDRAPGALFGRDRVTRHSGLEGVELGPYRLVRELGQGGMGVVYLAERRDVGVRVALKVLAAHVTGPKVRARFEYEQRILARLEHPHIARFLDAGIDEDGAPWLAMEYVEGRPIDEHCDMRSLGVRERLQLFERVAEAVAYAHRNLLVHRDLKPSNVLVSEDGRPKLVDFGIAKLLAPDGAEEELTVEPGCGPMTPQYASPEQLRCQPLTTASDVYQLGILLHELVTGRRPIGPGGGVLRDHDRATGGECQLPSSIVVDDVRAEQLPQSSTARSAAELAARRRASPRQLRRALAGDVDSIVTTALRFEVADRYASARELVDDVRRHLQDRPIVARTGGFRYRATKLARRQPVATALVLTLAVMLGVAATGLLLQAGRVSRERERAEQVALVLENLVGSLNLAGGYPDTSGGRPVVRDVATQARAGLSRDPEMWGRVLVVLGRLRMGMGEPDSALRHWREAIAALDARVAPHDRTLLDARSYLGASLVRRGEFAEGVQLLERTLRESRGLPPERQREVASRIVDAGFGRQVAGDDAGAERLYREALPVLARLPEQGGVTYDRTLVNLAFVLDRRGDFEGAETLLRQALARRQARDGVGHARTLNAQAALVRTLQHRGMHDEAARLAEQVLQGRRRLFRAPHPELAEALELGASTRRAQGRLEEAEAMARDAVREYAAAYGDDHFVVSFAQSTLVEVLATRGRSDEALALQREVVARYRRRAGNAHPATLAAMVRLATLQWEVARAPSAETLFREALVVLDTASNAGRSLERALTGLGGILAATGRCGEAASMFERATLVARGRAAESAGDEGEPPAAPRLHAPCESARAVVASARRPPPRSVPPRE